MSLYQWLTETAVVSDLAIETTRGDRLTYFDLHRVVERAADALLDRGVGPGRVVVMAARTPFETLLGVLATLAAGAAAWPVDSRLGIDRQREAIALAQPAIVISGFGPDRQPIFTPAGGEPRVVPDEAALILSTSGSTGRSKHVVLSSDALQANVSAILSYLPVRSTSRSAILLPLSYSYALVGQAFVSLRAGAGMVLLGDLPYPVKILERMVELGVTGLSTVPANLQLLAQAALERPEQRPQLAFVASAGSPLERSIIDLARRAFPEARLFNQYGLTEAGPRVTALSDDHAAFEEGSVGRPLPGMTVRVIDEDGQELPEGVVGDLVVESPSLMMGYLDDPEETARVLTPAGLRTGDRGCADARGFLYVVGRSDGVVQCAGERVSLRELEELMEAVPGVSLACVVAVPDELLGNRLVGFVETSGGGLDAVRARMHSLPAAKRPQWLIERSELPRLGNGKVDRQRLQHDAVRATGQH
jgi:acyl-CoA synthetase (AMP-forming)/AMP-acid ligase II